MKPKKKKSEKLYYLGFFSFLYKALNLHFIIAKLWPTHLLKWPVMIALPSITRTLEGQTIRAASVGSRWARPAPWTATCWCTLARGPTSALCVASLLPPTGTCTGGWGRPLTLEIDRKSSGLWAIRGPASELLESVHCALSPVYGMCLAVGNSTWARPLAFGYL